MYKKSTVTLSVLLSTLILPGILFANVTVVGETQGEFSVHNGAANYSIPIALESGRGGMQPQLSIDYSSQGGNGLLGSQWSLGGVSAIHRCSATLAQDNRWGSVNFNGNDYYCLDGQRLVPVVGNNGDVGTEYRTEIDSYSKIVSFGGSVNHPNHFVVKTKAGQTMVFGGGDASLVFPQGTLSWSLREINDSTGNNPITYDYFTHKNSHYLDKIQYSNRTVQLVYDKDRQDKRWEYIKGARITKETRLSAIETYRGTMQLRHYQFNYEYAANSGNSQLTSVTECGLNNECLPPVKINWKTESKGFRNGNTAEVSPSFSRRYGAFKNNFPMQWSDWVDVDGDGRIDHVRAVTERNGTERKRTWLNTESGWRANGHYTLPTVIRDYNDEKNIANNVLNKGQFVDVNGDGLVDWVVSYRYAGTWTRDTWLNTGTGWQKSAAYRFPDVIYDYNVRLFNQEMMRGQFIDLNNDGLIDWVRAYYHEGSKKSLRNTLINTGNGWRWQASYALPDDIYGKGMQNHGSFIDVNADGQPDWVQSYRTKDNGWQRKTWLNTGSGWVVAGQYVFPDIIYDYGYSDKSAVKRGDFVDLNGDGIKDWVRSYIDPYNGQTYQAAWLNHGNGWIATENYKPAFVKRNHNGDKGYPVEERGYYADLNSDGLIDYAESYRGWHGGQSSKAWMNTGSGWKADNAYRVDQWFNDYYKSQGKGATVLGSFMDINGDGAVDWVGDTYDHVATKVQRIAKADQLQSIVSSMGIVHAVEFKPLTDTDIYRKHTNAQYPVRDLQVPHYVVSQLKTSNGVGGNTKVEYFYEGLKSHSQGRGSYGFEKVIETHTDTDKIKTTQFDQRNFPYTGQVTGITESYNGQTLNESSNTYTAFQVSDGVHQVHLQQSVEKSYELGSASTSQPVVTISTYHNHVDQYGNIGQVIVSTAGGDQTFVKITDSTYTNDEDQWHLGRLADTSVIHQTHPAGTEERRRSMFTYDPSTGLLTAEKIVSLDLSKTLMTTTYTYDRYGQKTEVRLSADGEQDRVTTTVYNDEGRPTQTCNAYQQCETFEYTPEGWLASTTGPNGITTQWQYDGFGRKIREDRADGTYTTIERGFAVHGLDGQCGELAPFAHSCLITQTSGSKPVIVQYDKMNRKVRKITQGFDERLVYSDTEYNHLAQVSRVSRDYYLGNQIYWATSEYDILSRVTRATEPGPHGTTNDIITEYNGLTTTVRSGPQARAKTTTTNALGQKIRVEEEEGTYTEFTYNSDGNLLTTQVAGNNDTTITLSYDEFGRKVAMDDPDMGQWQYRYNNFGELISQTDAKGQTVTMEYDVLGRMISRNEPEGTSTWVYGDNTAPAGSIGKLLQESGNGITKNYSYDPLGRPVSTTTHIEGLDIASEMLTSEIEYDELSRVKRMIYPGSQQFTTENQYNDNGFLYAITGQRSQIEAHDYAALQPLVSEAVNLADEYLIQANNLRSIGDYYQSQIAYYQWLSGQSGALSDELISQLGLHHSHLSTMADLGENLSPEFLGHLNNTLAELQTVSDLLTKNIKDYEAVAEQLIVLAEQTLAAADHSFQVARTLDHSADAYNDIETEAASDTITYWRAVDVDASGRISAEVYGNGIVNDYAYNQATGQLQSIHSSLLTIDAIRHLEYQYDAYQNVSLRHDMVNDIRENYDYDRLDRLAATHVASDLYNTSDFNHTQSLTYDVLGNITHKSDVGDYFYGGSTQGAAGPHAVTQAGDKQYTYDANGNMISGDGRTIQWSSFNKPTQITRDGKSAAFTYGPNRARYKKVNHQGDTTLYIDKSFEVTFKADQEIEQKHYIYAAGQVVAEHIVSNTQGTQIRYLHKDALGSVDLVTDAYANVVDRRSFDAWGKLRNLPWKENATLDNPLYLTQLPFTNKGFTGHEHVQEVGLIHMNGRMYDATLARFISADPHIQEGSLSQNYNRYSYVMNNPLKYTDPSGYFFKRLFKGIKKALKKVWEVAKPFIGIAVGLAVSTFCAVCGGKIMAGAIAGAAAGAVSAAATGGNILEGALLGGLTGGVSKWIGGASGIFGDPRSFDIGRSLAHGVVGGVTNVIRGGKFGQGFISSAFTKFISDPIQGFAEKIANTAGVTSDILGATGAALVGGTASVLSGGKFANGAQTAAVQYLFNQVSKKTSEMRDLVETADTTAEYAGALTDQMKGPTNKNVLLINKAAGGVGAVTGPLIYVLDSNDLLNNRITEEQFIYKTGKNFVTATAFSAGPLTGFTAVGVFYVGEGLYNMKPPIRLDFSASTHGSKEAGAWAHATYMNFKGLRF